MRRSWSLEPDCQGPGALAGAERGRGGADSRAGCSSVAAINGGTPAEYMGKKQKKWEGGSGGKWERRKQKKKNFGRQEEARAKTQTRDLSGK